MTEDTVFYIAAGRSLAAINDYIEQRKAMSKKHKAFAARFGCKEWSINTRLGGSIVMCGLHFPEGKMPSTWHLVKRGGITYKFAVPYTKTKEGKALANEMQSMTVGAPATLGCHFGGDRMYTPGFEHLGDKVIISQHEKAEPPQDAIPMQRSEYWLLKEAQPPVKKEKKKRNGR